MTHLSPRKRNSTSISYILIARESPMTSPILAPEAFRENGVIKFIRSCPEDIHQLVTSLEYFEYSILFDIGGYDFQIVSTKNVKHLDKVSKRRKRVRMLFVDVEFENARDMYNELQKNADDLTYYCFFSGSKIHTIGIPNEVRNANEFIHSIYSNLDFILAEIGIPSPEERLSVDLIYKPFLEFNYFVPSHSNFAFINRIIGNFPITYSDQDRDKDRTREEAEQAIKSMYEWTRQKTYLDQISRLDFFWDVLQTERIIKKPTTNESKYAPLVLVIPYNNPTLKLIYDKEIYNLVSTEQTNNYTHSGLGDNNTALKIGAVAAQRLHYLDDVGFLHSSLSKSPVIRLPLKGKSIYAELSAFGTTFFSNLNRENVRKKLIKTITKLGEKLKKSYLSPELEDVIMKRDSQIVAISDVPIEWIPLKGIPLLFSHDVCRIPETSLHGVMALYTTSNMVQLSIPNDILSKTLVIFGSDEPNFLPWQKIAKDNSHIDGYITEQCKSLSDVKQAVKKHNPLFLIFDCHGGYDSTKNETYLVIGEERLTNEYVVANRIQAPLIFISACGTAPTYNITDSIANGFFQIGALSVTTTYLPISINQGSHLYIRILRLLKEAAVLPYHKNWLNFICHTIRTSIIHQAYRHVRVTLEDNIENRKIDADLTKTLAQTMLFSYRREVFNDIDSRINSLAKNEKKYFSSTIPEYLFYSNLGRSDLILFDSWKKKFDEENKLNEIEFRKARK